MRRGRAGAYGLWQARDYFMDRGAPTVIVSLLLGYLAVSPMLQGVQHAVETDATRLVAKYGSIQAARLGLLNDFNGAFIGQFVGTMIFLGALLAMNGIVASDRGKGYYRFLFAKPVSPMRYYGQAFLIHWAGFVLIATLLGALYGALVLPLLSTTFVLVVASMYLLYAGIVFLLSASFRGDWLILLVFTAVSTFMWGKYGESKAVIGKLLYALPPLSRTTDVYGALAKSSPVNWHLLEWFAGYGAACVIAGLIVLRVRRMAVA